MSHSYPIKDQHLIDEDLSTSSVMLSSSSSSSSDESNQSQKASHRPQSVRSCWLPTLIFSLNFVSSIMVINLSKWIYVKYHFPNLTLTMINFCITFIFLLICLRAQLMTHVRLPVLKMIPFSACFGGFIAFSNLSLQYNTVGTYQLIKLQVTPVVMLISWSFHNAHYPLPIILSFVPVLIGTLITTYYDLQLNVVGLLCAITSVLFTAIYQSFVEYYQKLYKCDSLQLLLYQAPISALLIFLFVPFFEPLNHLSQHVTYETICLILLCGFVAFFVNFSVFWVIGNLSAVAYNMIGHTKTLLIIVIGSIIFHEPLNQQQVFGLIFTMLGVVMYSYFKYGRKLSK